MVIAFEMIANVKLLYTYLIQHINTSFIFYLFFFNIRRRLNNFCFFFWLFSTIASRFVPKKEMVIDVKKKQIYYVIIT